MSPSKCFVTLVLIVAAALPALHAEDASPPPRGQLYMIATAHLDTQWRWTLRETINDFLPETLRANFELFEKYPGYVFNFEGAFRYMLIKEYYPESYQQLKQFIADGRWALCGAGLDGFDSNLPSPESLIRSTLYSQRFFLEEFGRRTYDVFLPDSFGFSYALPTVARHCDMLGFSTQKLGWGCAAGIPFRFGCWEGVDGSRLPAVLHAEPYNSLVREDLAHSPGWQREADLQAEVSGLRVAYRYFGTGDQGRAPDEPSVAWVQGAASSTDGLQVINGPADALFRTLTKAQIAALPVYRGELLMTTHGTGCYTSFGALKRQNRRNESLAAAAERACVVADWLGAADYPGRRLHDAQVRYLWHQHHDAITGTSVPEANAITWNDEAIAQNELSGMLQHAAAAWSLGLDTRTQGVPVVVLNPLAFERQDIVEMEVEWPGPAFSHVRVFDLQGRETPSQTIGRNGRKRRVLFVAQAPSLGMAVYELRHSLMPCRLTTGLTVTERSLENSRYRVLVGTDGNVGSIYDKRYAVELLEDPIGLDLLHDQPEQWPAWEISYADISAPALERVAAPAQIRVAEQGPVRIALEIVRHCRGSTFRQSIRLDAGAGDLVEFDTEVDWQSAGCLLKASFPTALGATNATYDIGVGTVQRGVNTETLYEVPAQKWAALSNRDGSYGVALMSDCRYGWDMPAAGMLRLSLFHSPRESLVDLGRHRLRYAVMGHAGTWQNGVGRRAAGFDQPLIPLVTDRHAGTAGRTMSFLEIDAPGVSVLALKQAEEGGAIIIRLVESSGQVIPQARIRFVSPIRDAREVNGLEEACGTATLEDGTLVTSFRPYQLRAFAVTLAVAGQSVDVVRSVPVVLPYNRDVAALPGEKGGGSFDRGGQAYPADQLPAVLACEDVNYQLGSGRVDELNAVACHGQSIELPQGAFNGIGILAAAEGGDRDAVFKMGDRDVSIRIQDFGEPVGRLNPAVQMPDGEPAPYSTEKPDSIAWVGTHRIDAEGRRMPYEFCYLFKYRLPYPAGSGRLVLPVDERIKIFAISAVSAPAADVKSVAVPANTYYSAKAQRFAVGSPGLVAIGGSLFALGVLGAAMLIRGRLYR